LSWQDANLTDVCSPHAVEEESLRIAELIFDGLRSGATARTAHAEALLMLLLARRACAELTG
jgi:predicted RNA-binding Zn ribbon-like protein